MLEQAFQDVYTKFKLHFYQNIFQRFATREATLTTVEICIMRENSAMVGSPMAMMPSMQKDSTVVRVASRVAKR